MGSEEGSRIFLPPTVIQPISEIVGPKGEFIPPDPRTFKCLTFDPSHWIPYLLALEGAEVEKGKENSYRVFWKYISIYHEIREDYPPKLNGKTPVVTPDLSIIAFNRRYRQSVNGSAKILDVPWRELLAFARTSYLLPGTQIVEHYGRVDLKGNNTIRADIAVSRWGLNVPGGDIIDLDNKQYLREPDVVNQLMFRDIVAIKAIMEGRSYEELILLLGDDANSRIKILLSRALSRSSINALRQVGVLDDQNIDTFYQNGASLLFQEAVQAVVAHRANRGYNNFEAALIVPFFTEEKKLCFHL